RLLHAQRGRGVQMHAGAQVALGDIFWFVHADTHPPHDAVNQIETILSRPNVSGGCFAVHFDSTSRQARFLEWFYTHLRGLGFFDGDATLFIPRGEYEGFVGFRPFPLFEDVALVGRLRQLGRFLCLRAAVIPSSRRFEGRRFVRVLVWWMI